MKFLYPCCAFLGIGAVCLSLFSISVGGQTPSPPHPVTASAKITKMPKPLYTEEARTNKIQGKVILKVTFLENGKIGLVEVVCGLPFGLNDEAIKAANSIIFEPAKRDGVAYTTTKRLEYNFKSDFEDVPELPCQPATGSEYQARLKSIDDIVEQPKEIPCQKASYLAMQGFRLGMSENDVLRRLRLPRSKVAPQPIQVKNADGVEVKVNVGQSRLEFIDVNDEFDGVNLRHFYFHDGKLFGLVVMYDGTIKWEDIKEYSETLGKSLNLPPSGWSYSVRETEDPRFYFNSEAHDGSYILCDGIVLYTSLERQRGFQPPLNPITRQVSHYKQFSILRNQELKMKLDLLATELAENYRKAKLDEEAREEARKKRTFKP